MASNHCKNDYCSEMHSVVGQLINALTGLTHNENFNNDIAQIKEQFLQINAEAIISLNKDILPSHQSVDNSLSPMELENIECKKQINQLEVQLKEKDMKILLLEDALRKYGNTETATPKEQIQCASPSLLLLPPKSYPQPLECISKNKEGLLLPGDDRDLFPYIGNTESAKFREHPLTRMEEQKLMRGYTWPQRDKVTHAAWKCIMLSIIEDAKREGISEETIARSVHFHLQNDTTNSNYVYKHGKYDITCLKDAIKALSELDLMESHYTKEERFERVKQLPEEMALDFMDRIIFEFDQIFGSDAKGRNRIIKSHFVKNFSINGIKINHQRNKWLLAYSDFYELALAAENIVERESNAIKRYEKEIGCCSGHEKKVGASEVIKGVTADGLIVCFRCSETLHLGKDCKNQKFCAICGHCAEHTTRYHHKMRTVTEQDSDRTGF